MACNTDLVCLEAAYVLQEQSMTEVKSKTTKRKKNGVSKDKGAIAANEEQGNQREQKIDPQVAEKINTMRTRFASTFSQVVISLMNSPRYRHQSISDLEHLVTEPLIRNRIAIEIGRAHV